jgi:1,2-diacylglycerol 3-alpha-glucosyltransferase
MRIAYLTQSYPPMISGAALVAHQLAEAMANRGHQVLVIAASDREAPYQTYQDNLTILRLRSFNNPLRVGQRLISHPRRATLRALRKFQPDIIHAHEPVQMGMLALEYARRAHIPVAITAHQLPWFIASYLPDIFKPIVEKTIWLCASKVLHQYTSIIAPTKTISMVIKQMTGLDSRVISYGLDFQTFHPPLASDDGIVTRKKLNLPWSAPIILHVGRLDTDKNARSIVQAAAQALQNTQAHLLIIGDGKEKPALIKLCQTLGIADRTHFTGYLTVSNGLADIYRIANVFITASEIETQGIVLLEAAASGLPIVAVNATCVPEIVHDHINGFLVKPGDAIAFGNAIANLVNEPNMAKAMGQEGLIFAEEHAVQRTWHMHEQLYLEKVKQAYIQRISAREKWQFRWDIIKEWIRLK